MPGTLSGAVSTLSGPLRGRMPMRLGLGETFMPGLFQAGGNPFREFLSLFGNPFRKSFFLFGPKILFGSIDPLHRMV
jgi:hypothetical protein